MIRRPAREAPGGEAGSAVALALILLLVLSLAFAVLSAGVVARMQEEQREARSVRLSAACDAALARTLAELAASPDSLGFPPEPFAGGTIESEVRSFAERLLVRARARQGNRTREIEAEVQFSSGRPWVARWRLLR